MRHLFAIGDNGFRSDPQTEMLYRYILSCTGKERPRVCLIPTASGDAQDYMDAFHAFFGRLGCEISQISLFRGETEDLEGVLARQDLVYVTGGNTRNMLVLWREWGLDQLIRKAYERGVVMAGGSAGALCWFEGGVTDSIPGRFSSMNCMGVLQGSHCPHYNEFTRRPYYLNAVQTGELPAGLAAENGVALHFVDEKFLEPVSHFEGRAAYRVEKGMGQATEIRLPARQLLPGATCAL